MRPVAPPRRIFPLFATVPYRPVTGAYKKRHQKSAMVKAVDKPLVEPCMTDIHLHVVARMADYAI